MRIVIGSAFRNMNQRLVTYFSQVNALAALLGHEHSVRVIAVEGDSTDATRRGLRNDWGVPVQCIEHDHGKRVWGSTVDPERFTALSGVANHIFASVRDEDDVLVYVESDLLWEPVTMLGLMAASGVAADVVAPMVFAGEAFYDIWAFRKDGEAFTPFPPYHPGLHAAGVTKVDSVGSCLVMGAHVARLTPPMTHGALVEWCGNARRTGFSIGVAPQLRIEHPA